MAMGDATTTPGRPRIGRRITLVVDDVDLALAGELARAQGIKRSEWLRAAIRAQLAAATRVDDPAGGADEVGDQEGQADQG